MATTSMKYAGSTASWQTESGGGSISRNKPVSATITSNKTSGSWITFPDGSKFRLPTAYSKQTYRIEGKSPNIQVGEYKAINSAPNSIRNYQSSPGGYYDDDLMAANCPGIGGLTMNKLYDGLNHNSFMVNEAVTKALNDIASQKANIGENLATMRQTMQMIRNPASTLASSLKEAWSDRSLRSFLRRSVRDIRRDGPMKHAAQRYLEYVYGWKPLMSDIYGIMELMKEKGGSPLLLSGRGVSNQQKEGKLSSYWNPSQIATTKWLASSEKVKTICKIYGRIDPNSAGVRSLNQLGLLNPASLAWDLMPWSFVIDWFVPIGPVLSALTAPAGLTFVSGTRSTKTSFQGSYSHARDPYGNVIYTNQPGTGNAFAEKYRRDIYTSWPIPGIYFSSDPFRNRELKALALTIVNLRGLRI